MSRRREVNEEHAEFQALGDDVKVQVRSVFENANTDNQLVFQLAEVLGNTHAAQIAGICKMRKPTAVRLLKDLRTRCYLVEAEDQRTDDTITYQVGSVECQGELDYTNGKRARFYFVLLDQLGQFHEYGPWLDPDARDAVAEEYFNRYNPAYAFQHDVTENGILETAMYPWEPVTGQESPPEPTATDYEAAAGPAPVAEPQETEHNPIAGRVPAQMMTVPADAQTVAEEYQDPDDTDVPF